MGSRMGSRYAAVKSPMTSPSTSPPRNVGNENRGPGAVVDWVEGGPCPGVVAAGAVGIMQGSSIDQPLSVTPLAPMSRSGNELGVTILVAKFS